MHRALLVCNKRNKRGIERGSCYLLRACIPACKLKVQNPLVSYRIRNRRGRGKSFNYLFLHHCRIHQIKGTALGRATPLCIWATPVKIEKAICAAGMLPGVIGV